MAWGRRPRHGEDDDCGCCRSRPRRRQLLLHPRLLIVPKCPNALKVCSSRGGAEEAGQRWGRGRRPEAVGVGNRRGSRRPQKEEATRDLSNPASTAAGARSSLGHEQGDEGCAVSCGGGPRRGRQCIFPLCGRRRRWAAAAAHVGRGGAGVPCSRDGGWGRVPAPGWSWVLPRARGGR